MKKFFGSFAVMALASTFLWAGQANADSGDFVTLNLSGEVPMVAEIGISPDGTTLEADDIYEVEDLDLTQALASQTMAYVHEKCNDLGGYTISLVSSNEGALVGQTDGNFSHEYAITYGGAPVTLTAGAADVTQATAPNASYPEFDAKIVAISFAGDDTLPAQVYADTLTFTITVAD